MRRGLAHPIRPPAVAFVAVVVTLLSAAIVGPRTAAFAADGPCAGLRGGVRIEIFMTVSATDAEIAGVRELLESSRLVKRFRYLDRAAAYEEFARIFREDPDLVRNIDPDMLPPSFRIVPKRAAAVPLEDVARTLPGVDDVAVPDRASKAWKAYCKDAEQRVERTQVT
jgi:cell division protein FtsX